MRVEVAQLLEEFNPRMNAGERQKKKIKNKINNLRPSPLGKTSRKNMYVCIQPIKGWMTQIWVAKGQRKYFVSLNA
jgi:hypothetical protein